MLKSLLIKDLALIDEVKISFTKGFNVFTGETGAGKSIIINAIGLLLGNKAEKTLIKEGKQSLKVEALFDVSDSILILKDIFEELNIEEEDLVSLTRVCNISGKSEYFVNGERCTLNLFKKVSLVLLDIFGQHDNQKLLDKNNHIVFLDKYIGKPVEGYKENLRKLLEEYRLNKKEIQLLGGNKDLRTREIDFLEYEIRQIESAELKDGEDEELLNKKKILENSEKIYNSLLEIFSLVKGNCDINSNLKESINILGNLSRFDSAMDGYKDRLQSVRWELDDIFTNLESYSKTIDFDEKSLENIDNRLDLINGLKRKYGRTVSEVLQYLDEAKRKLDMLYNCDEKIAELETERNRILHEIYEESYSLHQVRVEKLKVFEKQMIEELRDLGMKNAQFKIAIIFPDTVDDIENSLSVDGLDVVEFMFSANLGQSVKSLDKIVSGGELSRFSLAFKTIVNIDGVDKTLIFDEIDTGIGGNTGSVVGKKITRISRNCQVICITHLAQIASFADSHFKIVKSEVEDKTVTNIALINEQEKVKEIGRMIGSIDSVNYAELHSKELILESNNFKLSLA